MAETNTTGHCPHKNAPGGCQLHNLQCGYPECDRKATTLPPMPVDPLEEARERLERDLELQDGGGTAYTCHDELYTVVVQGEDLRLILAELDRRPPPTGEGDWVLVPREPTAEQLAPYRGLNRTRDASTVAARIYRDMLAAAPPPPDA